MSLLKRSLTNVLHSLFFLVLTRRQEKTHHNNFENPSIYGLCIGVGVVFCAECDLALNFEMLSDLNTCLQDRQGLFIYGISFGTFPSLRTRLHAINKLKKTTLSISI